MKSSYILIAIQFNSFEGYEDVVRALIELGAKVDAEDNKKKTPLHRAAHWGKHFLKKFFDPFRSFCTHSHCIFFIYLFRP